MTAHTPNDLAIADVYRHWFAARLDDFVTWTGETWVRANAPLTPEVILAAFSGGPPVSAYTITPQNETHVCCIDFDSDDGLDLAKRLRAAMAGKGVTAYVEVSRRGGHLWVVLDRVLPARTVRRALRAFLRDAGIPILCAGSGKPPVDRHCAVCPHKSSDPVVEEHDNPKIEFRPAADEIKPDGFGSPIRMPTMPHPKTGRRYPLLGSAADHPLSPRLGEMLLALDLSPAWMMESVADTIRPTIKDVKHGDRKAYSGPSTEGSASDILRTLWGAIDARPNHSIRCPAHDDKMPSLSILADDQRAVCHAPHCELNNNDRGRGTHELTVMAPKRGDTK